MELVNWRASNLSLTGLSNEVWWATRHVLEQLGREYSQPTVVVVNTAMDDFELPRCDSRCGLLNLILVECDLYRQERTTTGRDGMS